MTRLRANWSWRTCHSGWPTLRIISRKVVHRDFAFAAVALFVNIAMAIAGQVQDRLANGFRGDRAGVERDAAEQFLSPLDDGDAPILFGGGNGRLLSGRSASDDDQIVSHNVIEKVWSDRNEQTKIAESTRGRGKSTEGSDRIRLLGPSGAIVRAMATG